MARKPGSLTLNGALEVGAQAPLDARLVVKTKADLLDAASYPYAYIGMIVAVADDETAYMLIADDTTDEASWKEIGSGSSGTYDYLFSWDATSRSLVLNEGTADEQKLRLSGLAAPSDIPTKLSELENDSKYQTDTEVAASITSGIANKVDKVDGKGLSPEEFTSAEKAKLASLADVKTIGDGLELDSNGELTATSVLVDLTDYYTREETDAIIANINGLDFVTVTALPTENIRTDCIYLLNDSTETGNLYSEYVYIDGQGWERFGSAQIDLSNYYTKDEVDAAIEASGSSSGQSATDTEVNQIISDVFGNSSGGNDPGFDPNEP